MAFEFKLPDVGEGLHEAELLRWLVKEGDTVTEDQPIMEVQTDKATVEITSPVNGKVVKLFGQPGDILKVHSVVVIFDDGSPGALPTAGEVASGVAAAAPGGDQPQASLDVPAPAAPQPAAPGAPAQAPPAGGGAPAPGGRALAAPATRRLARELGVDINQVPGTGPAGRVTSEDVRAFAAGRTAPAPGQAAGAPPAPEPVEAKPAPQAAPAPATAAAAADPADERIPLRGIRKVIAERMVKSKYTAPHVTAVEEVDMTELLAFRAQAKELAARKGIKLSFMPFVIKAVVAALREFPYLNASIDDEAQEIVLHRRYHIGFALDTDAGLLVPVIKDADRKPVFTIAAEMNDLIARGREGKLAPDEMRGSTFTISNQGSIGGLFFTPVINHPEVAILGIGKTAERPVVRNGEIVIRQMAHLALSFDHRLIDGGMATRFLLRLAELLGDPNLLMMEAM